MSQACRGAIPDIILFFRRSSPLIHEFPSAAQHVNLNSFRWKNLSPINMHLNKQPMSQDTRLQLFSNLSGVCRASDCTEHSQQRGAERQKQAAAVDLCPGPGHDTSPEALPLPKIPPLEIHATGMPEIRIEYRGHKAFTPKWFQSCNTVSAQYRTRCTFEGTRSSLYPDGIAKMLVEDYLLKMSQKRLRAKSLADVFPTTDDNN